MSQQTPRILPIHLSNFAPSNHNHPSTATSVVRLLGTITALHGDTATLSSGGYAVTCLLNRDAHLRLHGVYEVVGKVVNLEGGQGEGVRLLTSTEWPDKVDEKTGEVTKVDLRVYDAVVSAIFVSFFFFFLSLFPISISYSSAVLCPDGFDSLVQGEAVRQRCGKGTTSDECLSANFQNNRSRQHIGRKRFSMMGDRTSEQLAQELSSMTFGAKA